MKKIYFCLILLILINSTFISFALDLQYSVHTSAKDIENRKQKALSWYENNVINKKFYFYDANKHIGWLKNRSLEWYQDNSTKGKSYFIHADKELEFIKNKALRWYDKNSK